MRVAGARSLAEALAGAYLLCGDYEQHLAALRDLLAAASADEAAARAQHRYQDVASAALATGMVRTWPLSMAGSQRRVRVFGTTMPPGSPWRCARSAWLPRTAGT